MAPVSLISVVTSRSLWEWCGLQGLLLAVGIFESPRSFIGGSSFFFVSGTDVAFSARSATSRPQPTTSCRLWKEWQQRARHRHGLEVEDEGHLKILM
jgi:hypothetical protein